MKKRVLEKAVEYIKAHPQKLSKPSKPTLLPLHGTGQDKGSPPASPGLTVTSPARKMMPPVKNYHQTTSTPTSNTWKYSAIPPAKTVTQTTNHMMARKRSYDGGVQQNGIDGEI